MTAEGDDSSYFSLCAGVASFPLCGMEGVIVRVVAKLGRKPERAQSGEGQMEVMAAGMWFSCSGV